MFGRKAASGPDYEALAASGEQITDFESQWLEGMIAADGQVDALESRLIERLAAED